MLLTYIRSVYRRDSGPDWFLSRSREVNTSPSHAGPLQQQLVQQQLGAGYDQQLQLEQQQWAARSPQQQQLVQQQQGAGNDQQLQLEQQQWAARSPQQQQLGQQQLTVKGSPLGDLTTRRERSTKGDVGRVLGETSRLPTAQLMGQ